MPNFQPGCCPRRAKASSLTFPPCLAILCRECLGESAWAFFRATSSWIMNYWTKRTQTVMVVWGGEGSPLFLISFSVSQKQCSIACDRISFKPVYVCLSSSTAPYRMLTEKHSKCTQAAKCGMASTHLHIRWHIWSAGGNAVFPGVSMACVFAMDSGTRPKQRISSFIPVCINIDMLKKKKKAVCSLY